MDHDPVLTRMLPEVQHLPTELAKHLHEMQEVFHTQHERDFRKVAPPYLVMSGR